MKQNFSRRTFLKAAGVSAGAVALAACAPAATQPQAAGEAPSGEAVTLTYWTALSANVAATLQSYNDMTCYKELEKITGVHIEFQHVPDNP